MKKRLFNFLKLFVGCFVVSIVMQFLFHGFPHLGLPEFNNIEAVEIKKISTNESITVTEEKEIEMARNVANFLNFTIGKSKKESPEFQIVYKLKNQNKVEISANTDTVYFKGKSYDIKGDNGITFCNIVDGYFFNH